MQSERCPDDNVLADFAEQRLAGDALRALESHLDRCPACLALTCDLARFESDPTVLDADRALDRSDDDAPAIGSLLGRYRLLGLVGSGAMGLVYAARDTQLDRKIALKIVRPERLSEPDSTTRLLREARAMAQLSHPNVVTIYDAGQVEDRTFIAMEFVEGVTFASWQDGKSWKSVLRAMRVAGRGLAAAHAAGIVHRDFKPENVLVEVNGRLAVTDFGLAAIPQSAAPVHTGEPGAADGILSSTTETGTLLGTPRYMSPEQHAGGKVDARSDQFAFAVALYEAIYRERAFAGATLAELRANAMQGRVRDAPLGTDVPKDLRACLLRGLSADPADRYPTLDDMLAALEPHALPESPAVPPPDGTATSSPLRMGSWAAAAILLLAISGVALLSPQETRQASRLPTVASAAPRVLQEGTQVLVLGLENRTMDPVFDGTLDLLLESALTRSPALYPIAGSSARALVTDVAPHAKDDEELGRAVTERTGRPLVLVRGSVAPDGPAFALSLAAETETGARLWGTTLRAEGSSQIVPTMARLACDLRTALRDVPCDEEDARQAGLSANLEADHAFAIGRGASNAGQLADALPALERATLLDPSFAAAHHALGLLLWNMGRAAEGKPHLARAVAEQSGLSDRQRLAIGAGYHILMDEFDLASRSYEELLTRWPADTRYRGNLAQAYLQGGEIDKGVATAVQAATDNSKSAVVRSNLPMALLIGGALNDAQRDGLRTLADLPHPLPLAYVAVAAADALLGKRDAALELQGRLVAIDPSVAAASRADFALFEGRITDAIALLEAGIADDTAKKATAAAEAKWATLAEAELRREHLAAARQAAAHAVGSRELVTMMRVARVLARAGSPDSELDGRIRAHPGQRAEVFARIVAIDDRRSKADVDPLDVGHGSGSWLLYADRGARLFKDGAWDGARRAFEECLSHLGQGAMAFVDDTATLRYIPEVRFLHARTLDALHDPGAAAAYKAFLDSEPDAQGDPMVTAAKLRAASL